MRVSHMTAVAVAAIVCISSQANAQDPTRRYLSIAQAKYSICTMIAETAAITGVMEKLDECAYEMVDRDIRPMFADAAASLAKNKKALELLKEHMAITSSAFSALQPSSGELVIDYKRRIADEGRSMNRVADRLRLELP